MSQPSSAPTDLDPSQLLSVEEAARFMRKSTRTIRRWVEQGDLAGARRVKQQIFIPRADLLAMFQPIRSAA